MEMQALNISFPGKLVFGKGSIEKLANEIVAPGISKVLILN
jgi:alcohol dehydrogenase YqhD (iron-dependent ADH family)